MVRLDKYQDQAIRYLIDNNFSILGDEPGVGKTYPAIYAALHNYKANEQQPILIVAPAYLAYNWKYELMQCGETEDNICIVQGTMKAKKKMLLEPYKWYIISYALTARKEYLNLLLPLSFSSIIYDEAHRLRGRNSLRTKAAYKLRKKTNNLYMLTGTPTVANAGDMFPLLKLCAPKTFTSYWKFVDQHCYLIRTPWTTKIGRLRNEDSFHKLLENYMLRRKLSETNPQLKEAIEQTIIVELSDSSKAIYKKAKQDYLLVNEDQETPLLSGGALVAALRRLTIEDNSKVEAVAGLLEDHSQEQIVIFCWYRNTVERVLQRLERFSRPVAAITGATSNRRRNELIAQFKQQDTGVLVATLGALKEGVNLQFAHTAIFIEEDWLAATNEQATGRLRRRGQLEPVVKYIILARKTIDQSVHRVQQRRAEQSLEAVLSEEFRNES